uniref:diphthine methyl ester synthase n=1 Tax=Timema douglasi TaxID=61478 RepID=A0A7R8Z6N1_TIMDO|nr:unnamed protein product [Timema douglasi]
MRTNYERISRRMTELNPGGEKMGGADSIGVRAKGEEWRRDPKPSGKVLEFIHARRSGKIGPFPKSFRRETKQKDELPTAVRELETTEEAQRVKAVSSTIYCSEQAGEYHQGLGDVKDITIKGLEIIKKADRVYLEAYTSILCVGKDVLEQFYECPVILADRDLVEQGSDEILRDALTKDIAFLVVGDPFGATTHTDLVLRAQEAGIPCQVVHNASIMNAIGCCGLQLYSFGETVSIPYWTDTWQPDSFYDKIASNRSRGLHTLCLLDIRVKEPTAESLTKKKKEYQAPCYMSVNVFATEKTLCVGVARVGSPSQKIVACSLEEMRTTDLGSPLHSLVIVGRLQPLELEYLVQFAASKEALEQLTASDPILIQVLV